jgi:AcrR family transcriptional regulator
MCMMSTFCSPHVNDVNIVPAKRPRRPAPRAGYHHGHLREALIEAGLAHLERADAATLSLRDLARRTGVSANAVYRHFDDKEALQAALAAEGFRRLLAAQIAAADARRSPRDTLLESGRAYLRFARSQPALYRLMFGHYGATHRHGELGEAAIASFAELGRQVGAAFGLDAADKRVGPSTVYVWSPTPPRWSRPSWRSPPRSRRRWSAPARRCERDRRAAAGRRNPRSSPSHHRGTGAPG